MALAAGRDLDATWLLGRGLGLSSSRYDPRQSLIMSGAGGLIFTDGVPAGTVYLDIAGLDAFHLSAKAAGVPFTAPPTSVHLDREGQFGPAGEEEWMAFLKDPAGNTIGLVERRPAE